MEGTTTLLQNVTAYKSVPLSLDRPSLYKFLQQLKDRQDRLRKTKGRRVLRKEFVHWVLKHLSLYKKRELPLPVLNPSSHRPSGTQLNVVQSYSVKSVDISHQFLGTRKVMTNNFSLQSLFYPIQCCTVLCFSVSYVYCTRVSPR